MHTSTCTLRFKDGAEATGRVSAVSANAKYQVIYDGAYERLPLAPERSDSSHLIAYFRRVQRDLDAELTIRDEGEYGLWAEAEAT